MANPLKNPPPPTLPKRRPGRPSNAERAAQAAAGKNAAAPATPGAPSPADAPSPARRVLPVDPEARKAALAEVAPTVSMVLAILDVLATRLPPAKPLTDEEKNAIAPPLGEVLYKYGGEIPCEVALAGAVGMVALGRYVEWQSTKPAKPSPRDGVSPLADDKAKPAPANGASA